jgi:hypothetical protein
MKKKLGNSSGGLIAEGVRPPVVGCDDTQWRQRDKPGCCGPEDRRFQRNGQQACRGQFTVCTAVCEANFAPLHARTEGSFGAIVGRLDTFEFQESEQPSVVRREPWQDCGSRGGDYPNAARPPVRVHYGRMPSPDKPPYRGSWSIRNLLRFHTAFPTTDHAQTHRAARPDARRRPHVERKRQPPRSVPLRPVPRACSDRLRR